MGSLAHTLALPSSISKAKAKTKAKAKAKAQAQDQDHAQAQDQDQGKGEDQGEGQEDGAAVPTYDKYVAVGVGEVDADRKKMSNVQKSKQIVRRSEKLYSVLCCHSRSPRHRGSPRHQRRWCSGAHV